MKTLCKLMFGGFSVHSHIKINLVVLVFAWGFWFLTNAAIIFVLCLVPTTINFIVNCFAELWRILTYETSTGF